VEWYLAPFRKYADFSGRARRREYWTFCLVNAAISGIGSGLSRALPFIGIIVGLYGTATLIPGLAVSWRRLHDVGKSGAWYFMALIPFVGWILLLIQLVKDSVPGPNEYGPNPKEAESAANMV
jgi:uncharacterized membrane protein YhaH (DUF805 family)